ncbi:MAG: hypothetical protein II006_01890 [Peptostreptococcaceae bacterium]|jgi:hypothetical protein|nr:hypothetical protein [Peptostreptococcaceae bacterium]MBP3928257.1 hypothetical protein [Peptostreptococcaceae bacterium]MBQ1793384.1 hypothetical protein [Peptostreptococcaceae bacterium]
MIQNLIINITTKINGKNNNKKIKTIPAAILADAIVGVVITALNMVRK